MTPDSEFVCSDDEGSDDSDDEEEEGEGDERAKAIEEEEEEVVVKVDWKSWKKKSVAEELEYEFTITPTEKKQMLYQNLDS